MSVIGGGIEFVVVFGQVGVDVVEQFGWEWIGVDVSGIGFGDIQYVVQVQWVEVGIGGGIVSGGVGIGYVGVGVMVDVQQ